MNWLSLIGISIALIGTLICTINSLGYTRRFPLFKDINHGLEKIKDASVMGKDGKKIRLLRKEDRGFKKISTIIISNLSVEIPPNEIHGIMKQKGMSFSSGERSLDIFNALYFVYRDREPFLIGSEAIIEEWIKTYKFKLILTIGFGIIFIGFLFRFVSHFIK